MRIREYLATKKRDIEAIDVKPRLVEFKLNKNFIMSIVGPRRSGKTYFLYYVIKSRGLSEKDFLFVDFEEPIEIVDPLQLPYIHQEMYGVHPEYIFLDEIQALDNWVKVVYSLHAKKRYYIFITSSSSKLLAKEIATQLRGRAIPIYIYPFSLAETLLAKNIKIKKPLDLYMISTLKHTILTHMEIGFFPDVVLGNIVPSTFFREYLDLVIYKDIIERYGIRNRYALEFLVKSALSSNTKEFSIRKVYSTLKSRGAKVSKKILYNFQKILEDIRIFFFLRKYDKSLRRIELSTPKVYAVDTGLATYYSLGKSRSKQMEHLVLLELIKAGLEPNKNIFYWKDPQKSEVDFVILKNDVVEQLIQVTYASSRDEIRQREIKALIKASKRLNCRSLVLITWDYEEKMTINRKTVDAIPLWKWLLKRADNNKKYHAESLQ